MDERAGARLSVDVVAKKSRLRMVGAIFEMLFGQMPSAPADEFRIIDRATGRIVARWTVDEGPGIAGEKRAIEDELETMDLTAFCAKYNVTLG